MECGRRTCHYDGIGAKYIVLDIPAAGYFPPHQRLDNMQHISMYLERRQFDFSFGNIGSGRTDHHEECSIDGSPNVPIHYGRQGRKTRCPGRQIAFDVDRQRPNSFLTTNIDRLSQLNT